MIVIFQSPFHRGNGCNLKIRALTPCSYISFSPLFIGVTVVTSYGGATTDLTIGSFSPLFIGVTVVTHHYTGLGAPLDVFQSPFHRGNGCNRLL